jgi:hypothetical protein
MDVGRFLVLDQGEGNRLAINLDAVTFVKLKADSSHVYFGGNETLPLTLKGAANSGLQKILEPRPRRAVRRRASS